MIYYWRCISTKLTPPSNLSAIQQRIDLFSGPNLWSGLNALATWNRDTKNYVHRLSTTDGIGLWDSLKHYPLLYDTVINAIHRRAVAWVAIDKNDPNLLARAAIPDAAFLDELAYAASSWRVLSTLAAHRLWDDSLIHSLLLQPPSPRNKPKLIAKIFFHWDMLPLCVHFDNIPCSTKVP